MKEQRRKIKVDSYNVDYKKDGVHGEYTCELWGGMRLVFDTQLMNGHIKHFSYEGKLVGTEAVGDFCAQGIRLKKHALEDLKKRVERLLADLS